MGKVIRISRIEAIMCNEPREKFRRARGRRCIVLYSGVYVSIYTRTYYRETIHCMTITLNATRSTE